MAQKRKTFTLYSSSSSSTTTFTSSVDLSIEPEKPGWGQASALRVRRHPPVLHMVLEALRARQHPRGTSVAAIKIYILHKYPTVDVLRLKYLLRQALATGMNRGLLTRPANSKAKGATGSFKLVPKPKKKIQTKKTCPQTAPRNPGVTKEQGPKSKAKKGLPSLAQAKGDPRKLGEGKAAHPKPGPAKDKAPQKVSKTKKDLSKPGQVQRGPPKAAEGKIAPEKANTAEEKTPQNGTKARKAPQNGTKARKAPQDGTKARKAPQNGTKARKAPQNGTKARKAPQNGTKAGKAPQHPDEARRASPSGKSEAAAGRDEPGARRNSKVKSQSSKPTVSKSKNGTMSPSGKEAEPQARAGAAAQGAGVQLEAQGPPKGSGAQRASAPPARKKKLDVSPKGSTSTVAGRRAEAKV